MQRVTFSELMKKFAETPVLVHETLKTALVKSAVEVQKTAVKKFGDYQPAVGPFEAWAVLSPATLKQKLNAGVSSDNPLIGSYSTKTKGVYPTALRQSIAIDVDSAALVAQVGTNNPLGKYHEFGTGHIPPRPFLRPALFENESRIREELSLAIAEVFKSL